MKRLIKNFLLRRFHIIADNRSDVWVEEKEIIDRNYPISVIDSSISAKTIGEGCRFFKCACYGNISFGRFTSVFGAGTVLSSILSEINIGSFCSIGQNVNIQDSSHRIDKISSYFMGRNVFAREIINDVTTSGDVTIEDDVWIGSNSVILSGVTIGRGSVIGAGSIVTKDIPRYSIAVGNPAKVTRKRFSDETISYLEGLRWWTWSVEKIKMNEGLFFESIDNVEKN